MKAPEYERGAIVVVRGKYFSHNYHHHHRHHFPPELYALSCFSQQFRHSNSTSLTVFNPM
jgi:hypothetical protein